MNRRWLLLAPTFAMIGWALSVVIDSPAPRAIMAAHGLPLFDLRVCAALVAVSESELPTISFRSRARIVGTQALAVFVPVLLIPLLIMSVASGLESSPSPERATPVPAHHAALAWAAAAAGTRVASPAWAMAISLLTCMVMRASEPGPVAAVVGVAAVVCLCPLRAPALAVPVVMTLALLR